MRKHEYVAEVGEEVLFGGVGVVAELQGSIPKGFVEVISQIRDGGEQESVPGFGAISDVGGREFLREGLGKS